MNPPMLASIFHPDKIESYPVWSHIDHDGVRFCARLVDDKVTIRFWSVRLDDVSDHDVHMLPVLRSLTEKYPDSSVSIDGIFIDKTALIYDTTIPGSYESRWNTLSEYITSSSSLQLVSYSVHENLESLATEFLRLKRQGENIVVRDPRGFYVSDHTNAVMRSTDLISMHTLTSEIDKLYLLVQEGYLSLLDTVNDDTVLRDKTRGLIADLVRHIIPELNCSGDIEIEVRFPQRYQDDTQFGEVIVYDDKPIEIALLSYDYNRSKQSLVVHASFTSNVTN